MLAPLVPAGEGEFITMYLNGAEVGVCDPGVERQCGHTATCMADVDVAAVRPPPRAPAPSFLNHCGRNV